MEKKEKVPHVYIILLILVVMASVFTYFIPSGGFERVKDAISGQTLVLPDSFTPKESSPVAIWKIPMKLFEACTQESTSKLIFFILFIGGSFEIILQTRSINRFFELFV